MITWIATGINWTTGIKYRPQWDRADCCTGLYLLLRVLKTYSNFIMQSRRVAYMWLSGFLSYRLFTPECSRFGFMPCCAPLEEARIIPGPFLRRASSPTLYKTRNLLPKRLILKETNLDLSAALYKNIHIFFVLLFNKRKKKIKGGNNRSFLFFAHE